MIADNTTLYNTSQHKTIHDNTIPDIAWQDKTTHGEAIQWHTRSAMQYNKLLYNTTTYNTTQYNAMHTNIIHEYASAGNAI